MQKNICPECKTENEPEYEYCKNCGFYLAPNSSTQNPQYEDNWQESVAQNPQQVYIDGFIADNIDGIPSGDMASFIGSKSNNFLKKFTKMQLSDSKISWCWPAAILGLILGPVGTAFWMFYRRMYKLGIIFLIIGVVIGEGFDLLTGPSNKSFKKVFDKAYEQIEENGEADIDELIPLVDPDSIAKRMIYSQINMLISIATCVVSGLFSMYWYKRHCVKKIRKYYSANVDARYHQIGLVSIGATSGGMAFLAVFIWIVSSGLIDTIILLF